MIYFETVGKYSTRYPIPTLPLKLVSSNMPSSSRLNELKFVKYTEWEAEGAGNSPPLEALPRESHPEANGGRKFQAESFRMRVVAGGPGSNNSCGRRRPCPGSFLVSSCPPSRRLLFVRVQSFRREGQNQKRKYSVLGLSKAFDTPSIGTTTRLQRVVSKIDYLQLF